ncbi:MAG TPA: HK97 family phage prohead protease [Anaerolineae bacterium]
MPYQLSENRQTVLNAETGEPVPGGEHASAAEAEQHLAALEANVSEAAVEKITDQPFDLRLGGEFSKVSLADRTVDGVATAEVVDVQKDLITTACAVAAFEKFDGTIREMHQPVAIGKLLSWKPVGKAINVSIYLSKSQDGEDALTKVQEGILKGLSLAGRALEWFYKTIDGVRVRVITKMELYELSLVDRPANPAARLILAKVDMPTNPKGFKNPQEQSPQTPAVTMLPNPASSVTINVYAGVPSEQNVLGAHPAAQVKVAEASTLAGGSLGPNSQTQVVGVAAPAIHGGTMATVAKSELLGQAAGLVGQLRTRVGNAAPLPELDQLEALLQVAADQGHALPGGNAEANGGPNQAAATAEPVASAPSTGTSAPTGESAATATVKTTASGSVPEPPVSSEPSTSSASIPASSTAAPASTGATGSDTASTPASAPASSSSSSGSSTSSSSSGSASGASSSTPSDSKTSSGDSVSKGEEAMSNPNEPLSAVPPQAAPGLDFTFFTQNSGERIKANLPAFMKALDTGSLRDAQKVAGGEFDEHVQVMVKYMLDKGGWQYKNIRKMHDGAVDVLDSSAFQKAALASTDLPGLYLIQLAKLLFPIYAGLRRRIPTTTPALGATQAQWRMYQGFQNFDFGDAMGVAEAATGQAMNETPVLLATPYVPSALNDGVNLQAIAAARGYDDPLQVAVLRSLTALLITEERNILGMNKAALGKPASLTGVTSGSGTLGNIDDKFQVSTVSYRGYVKGRKGKVLAGQDLYGESDALASATIPLNTVATCTLTWPAVPGAAAYNIYYAPHGANPVFLLQTTQTSYAVTSVSGVTAAVPNAADQTANTLGYEGLLSWAEESSIYSVSLNNKIAVTDQKGTALTSYAGGVVEFDAMLESMWNQWITAPSLAVMSPKTMRHVTKTILSSNNPAIYRLEVSGERGNITGGAFVTAYVNKYAPFADGTPRMIDFMAHPYMPDGKVIFMTETIPYPMARESRGFALDVQIPYTYFPLAQTTISYPFAMTMVETLECFYPNAQTSITGINVT